MKNIRKNIIATAESKRTCPSQSPILRRHLLSTGSTLLNLAMSDNAFGGFLKGKYYYMVGDSISGKTFLSMTCLAEASINKHFKNYKFIYDNVEDGCLMDIEKLFGEKVKNRIQPPAEDKQGTPIYSYIIEEFYYHLDDHIRQGIPFIYILDSMDSLSSEFEGNKFSQHKKAHREGKITPGSYGDGKAKKNSEGLRKVLEGLRKTDSILIILSQTRDNLGFGFEKKTRAGGHALKFYATTEVWSSIKSKIKKNIKGKERQVGVHIKLQVKKNRITGKNYEVEIDIYPSYGIDDTGTCIDYLVQEEWWEKKKQSIEANEFEVKFTRDKLISYIEENQLEKNLKSIVGKCWKEIDKLCILKRKKKYGLGVDRC